MASSSGNARAASVRAEVSKRQTAETRLTKPFCATPVVCCKRRLTSKLVMLTLPKDICARARKLALPGGAVRGAIGRHPKLIRHLRYPRSRPTYFPAGVGSRCFGRRTCVPVSFSQISTHSAPANGKWWLPFPPNFSLPGDKSAHFDRRKDRNYFL